MALDTDTRSKLDGRVLAVYAKAVDATASGAAASRKAVLLAQCDIVRDYLYADYATTDAALGLVRALEAMAKPAPSSSWPSSTSSAAASPATAPVAQVAATPGGWPLWVWGLLAVGLYFVAKER